MNYFNNLVETGMCITKPEISDVSCYLNFDEEGCMTDAICKNLKGEFSIDFMSYPASENINELIKYLSDDASILLREMTLEQYKELVDCMDSTDNLDSRKLRIGYSPDFNTNFEAIYPSKNYHLIN
jgi:hypothetical protein